MEEIEGEQTEGRRGREGGREEGGGGASLRLGYRRDRPTCPSDGAAGAGPRPRSVLPHVAMARGWRRQSLSVMHGFET